MSYKTWTVLIIKNLRVCIFSLIQKVKIDLKFCLEPTNYFITKNSRLFYVPCWYWAYWYEPTEHPFHCILSRYNIKMDKTFLTVGKFFKHTQNRKNICHTLK